FRAGTTDLASIAGLALALQLATDELEATRAQIEAVRDLFEARVSELAGVELVGGNFRRGVKHSSVHVSGVDGEALLMALDSLAVQASVGSACSAGSLEASH